MIVSNISPIDKHINYNIYKVILGTVLQHLNITPITAVINGIKIKCFLVILHQQIR